MMLRHLGAAVIACALVVLTIPAAHARHAHHHHHHYHHHHRVSVNHAAPHRLAFGGGDLVSSARRYIGERASQLGLPRSLWCADFMNKVLRDSGRPTTGSREAKAFLHYGYRLSGPQVGAIAVLSRGRGGHVGVVTGFDAHGNPVIISGNHNHKVGEGVYPRHRVLAYLAPPS